MYMQESHISRISNIPTSMLKVHLQLRFVRLLYLKSQDCNHKIILSLENKEKQQICHSQLQVMKDKQVLQLHTMGPFQLDMVAGSNKAVICPYELYFTIKAKQTVRRRVPLHRGAILKHLKRYSPDEQIQPLEQLYSFQGGQIIYCVDILKAAEVDDGEQFDRLSSQFRKTKSTITSSFISQPSQGFWSQKQTSTQSVSRQTKTQVDFDEKYDIFDSEKDHDSKTQQLVKKMSIEQLAEQYELQSFLSQSRSDSAFDRSRKSKRGYQISIDKGKVDKNEEKISKSRSNTNIYIIIALLIIGFTALLSDLLLGIKNKPSHHKEPTKIGKGKKDKFDLKSNQAQL